MLRIVLPATLALLLLPVASATHLCPPEDSPGIKEYEGNCLTGPFTPPLPYAAGCSSSLLLYANYLGSYTLGQAGQTAGWTIDTANHLVFGAPC